MAAIIRANTPMKSGRRCAAARLPRGAPKPIALRLRHPDGKPIRLATVNGRRHREFDVRRECVTITPGAATIIVRVDY